MATLHLAARAFLRRGLRQNLDHAFAEGARAACGTVGRLPDVRPAYGTRSFQASAAAQADAPNVTAQERPASSSEQVLLHCDWMNRQLWYDQLRAAGVPVTWPDDVLDWAAVRYAVGWNFTPAVLGKMPSLRAIASLGAGVDHAMRPGLIPPGVDIVRIVDPLMAQRMATWVLWAVINFQRKMDLYGRAQAERRWDKKIENLKPWDNGEVRVGIMGFGAMGAATAALLRAAGYDVAAWARTPRPASPPPAAADAAAGASGAAGVEDVPVFAGRGQLRQFVERTDVLVCLLPLTPETQGILSGELLSWLPRGSAVINAARGRHLDEQALVTALDEGRLGGAVLDVFSTEPLPPDSPLWSHPRVRITPHVSSITDVPNAVAQIADNYRRLVAGVPLINVADKAAGY
ncbi:hypothetical protein PLESTB_000126100 [Pleodorina starrii]|uniref:D-isomer specific 2-hydroxyacid dehydrogenase NAD-binding domain-containing protein n=1 Tax=Pleodorina starrii TaxID=330485 RepID=A0A9W6EXQ6_9CHLO|nr:hypothetical protein PLESTB_000126100 [Pleodorina starrii]GLC74243.1 hypothetical protein PLESTF_001480200 [Pleodorina starrii]